MDSGSIQTARRFAVASLPPKGARSHRRFYSAPARLSWTEGIALLVLLSGCDPEAAGEAGNPPKSVSSRSEAILVHSTPDSSGRGAPAVRFVEVGARSGLAFKNVSGSAAQDYILESMAAGAAFLDYDGDGYLDLFAVNGTRLQTPPAGIQNRLFHNEPDGGRDGHRVFREVEATLGSDLWGMGCAVADYDNDGDPDIYATYWGPNQLLRNDGDGRFAEIGGPAGVADAGWGSSAAFGDLDGDGLVDLYATNYIEFDLDKPPGGGEECFYKGLEVFCGPMWEKARTDRLWRNEGGDRFADKSAVAGVDQRRYPALGVVLNDFDADGDLDIYVANDGESNLLYRNDGHWSFAEVGAAAGVAYSGDGKAQAGMGVHSGDYDNDGDLDLFATNFSDDVNTLYRNDSKEHGLVSRPDRDQGKSAVPADDDQGRVNPAVPADDDQDRLKSAVSTDLQFTDVTYTAGLGGVVQPYLGWGTGFFDFDNDGWLDLFVANGHLYPQLQEHSSGLRYAQRNLLYHNRGGRFVEIGEAAGPGWSLEKVSRAAALGDFDNDGDVDLFIANLNDVPSLLRNDGGNRHNWLGLKLVGVQSNRDAIGARVRVVAGDLEQVREVHRGYGFQAQHDRRLLFGLGARQRVERVEIRWPSGRRQVVETPELRRYLTIREGDHEVVALAPPPLPPVDGTVVEVPERKEIAAESSAEIGAAGWKAEDYFQAGKTFHQEGRYGEARDALEEALRLDPHNLEAYVHLGMVLSSGMGRHEEAAAWLERGARRDSLGADMHYWLGKVYLSLDHAPRAIEALQRAVRLADASWEYHNGLGLAHLRAGQLEAAAAAFQQASRRASWAPDPHLHLAQVYGHMDKPQAVQQELRVFERLVPIQRRVERYQRQLAIDVQDVRIHTRLGMAYVVQGRLEQALAHFRQAIAQDSLHGSAHYGLGTVFYRQKKLEQAIGAFERACQVQPEFAEALNNLGRAYHQTERYGDAIAAYQKALALRPELASLYTNLGRTYAAQGRLEEAIAVYREGLKRDSSMVRTRDALAQLYALQGRLEEAVRQWETVLRLAPDQVQVGERLRRAREKIRGN